MAGWLVMAPSFPVFVLAKDSGEIMRFESIGKMQHELEAIDVENGEYEAWDIAGFPLRLGVQPATWLTLERVSAEPAPEQLLRALHDFARLKQVSVDDLAPEGFSALFERITSGIAARKKRSGLLKQLFGRERSE